MWQVTVALNNALTINVTQQPGFTGFLKNLLQLRNTLFRNEWGKPWTHVLLEKSRLHILLKQSVWDVQNVDTTAQHNSVVNKRLLTSVGTLRNGIRT